MVRVRYTVEGESKPRFFNAHNRSAAKDRLRKLEDEGVKVRKIKLLYKTKAKSRRGR